MATTAKGPPEAAGAAFKDTWTLCDVDEAWHGEVADRDPGPLCHCRRGGPVPRQRHEVLLIMMAVRLMAVLARRRSDRNFLKSAKS